MKWTWTAISLVALAFSLGCAGSSSDSAGGGAKKWRIAVIPKGTSHDFWNSVHAGVMRAADEFPEIEITWKGPLSEGDTADQVEIVESFIVDGYDGICLAPLDAVALRRPVDEAIRSNVPVVIFDSGLQDQSGIVSYVATNNHRGGQRAGEHLVDLIGGEGKVILMRYDINSQSTELREDGFLEALKPYEEKGAIEFLSRDKHAGPDESGAITLAENLLDSHGEEVDGIFCPNQSTTSGMLTALIRANLAGRVKLVGFDSGENIARGLREGNMQATILQDPVTMGYDAVRVMVEHLRGGDVPGIVETQEALATTENLDDAKIHSLLYPAAIE